eukprot:1090096-Pelagomonas_calceolata.AAC.2
MTKPQNGCGGVSRKAVDNTSTVLAIVAEWLLCSSGRSATCLAPTGVTQASIQQGYVQSNAENLHNGCLIQALFYYLCCGHWSCPNKHSNRASAKLQLRKHHSSSRAYYNVSQEALGLCREFAGLRATASLLCPFPVCFIAGPVQTPIVGFLNPREIYNT